MPCRQKSLCLQVQLTWVVLLASSRAFTAWSLLCKSLQRLGLGPTSAEHLMPCLLLAAHLSKLSSSPATAAILLSALLCKVLLQVNAQYSVSPLSLDPQFSMPVQQFTSQHCQS